MIWPILEARAEICQIKGSLFGKFEDTKKSSKEKCEYIHITKNMHSVNCKYTASATCNEFWIGNYLLCKHEPKKPNLPTFKEKSSHYVISSDKNM